MKPIVTARCDLVLAGPPGIGDLHGEHVRDGALHGIRTVWRLDLEEVRGIAQGGQVRLTVWSPRHPAVSLEVTTDPRDVGILEDAPDVLERLDRLRGDR